MFLCFEMPIQIGHSSQSLQFLLSVAIENDPFSDASTTFSFTLFPSSLTVAVIFVSPHLLYPVPEHCYEYNTCLHDEHCLMEIMFCNE